MKKSLFFLEKLLYFRYSFGLGKRSQPPLRDSDLYMLLSRWSLGKRSHLPLTDPQLNMLLSKWGMGGPHGLFKRKIQPPYGAIDDEAIKNFGWWGLSGPHGLFKRSSGALQEEKRGSTFSFGNLNFDF